MALILLKSFFNLVGVGNSLFRFVPTKNLIQDLVLIYAFEYKSKFSHENIFFGTKCMKINDSYN